MATIQQLIRKASELLESVSSTPRLDAEVILSQVLKQDRTYLIAHGPSEVDAVRGFTFFELINRRIQGEPVAYIVGRQEFWSLSFLVSPDVLIPRPETELLVGKALALAESFPEPVSILDLGTGSGCIAVAIGYELCRKRKKFSILAVDESEEALSIARENAKTYNVPITFMVSNWFSQIEKQQFSLILSNPPYVELNATNVSRETTYEPSEALYSGADGLDDIRVLMNQAPPYLAEGGALLFEFGFGQCDAIERLLAASEFAKERDIEFLPDLAGIDRVVVVS